MCSDQDKLLLYCVVGRKEIVALKELVDSIDPDAFVIVSDVREVLGEGFYRKKIENTSKICKFFSDFLFLFW